jgi:hypothetical protein
VISNKKLVINNKAVIDFNLGTMDTSVTIEANGETSNGLTLYDVLRNTTKVGTLAVYKTTAITANTIRIIDTMKYATENVFTEGSTNAAMGI